MDRLTPFGYPDYIESWEENNYLAEWQNRVYLRCMEYEDTGLTPEQVAQLQRERDAAVADIECILSVETSDEICEYCALNEGCVPRTDGCTPRWRGPSREE